MDDLLNEFLTETAESIDVIDVEIVKLEQDPNNKGVLDNIFRLVHTIKGTCGFLGLPRLEAVAHASENVLGKFRDGELEVTAEAVTLVLESLDCIKMILAGLAANEAEPEGDDSDLIGRLNACAAGQLVAAAPKMAAPAPEPEPEPEPERELKEGEVSLEELEAAFLAAPGPDDPEIAAAVAASMPAARSAAESNDATAEKPHKQEAPKAAEAKATDPKAGDAIGAQTIRVNVELLEDLMNMVSELVLTRNQLLQILRRTGDSEFAVPLQRLSQCTTELQEGVMKTRMQPIGNAWAKLPRIIRDLSVELGKKIDLQMVGADTELDRQVLELIKDPLTHMVRNSADHGIEMPADRLAAGKPETGVIRLNAYHEGGHIIVEVTDDGAGLNVARIKKKILANGLASEAELTEMSDQQVQKFIFHPGFSTAEKVTNVSGRGVGMDVVRSNIEKIGGTIDLKSTEGQGTSFIIKIPLTLAIVAALIVKCGSERFAIPQISVLELVRVSAESDHRIEHINATPVLRLRDHLLPLINLHDVLQLPRENQNGEEFIVVTQVGTFTFGIVVDQVYDTEEIVVKPVAPILRDLTVYSGNTILGDGSVIMILDPNGIAAQTADVMSDTERRAEADVRATHLETEREAMLVFRAGSRTPRAVPLSLVARLEELPVETVEYSDGEPVVQYRDQLMPLAIMDGCRLKDEGRQPVIVFTDHDRSMGLAVDEIIDIVEDKVEIELLSDVKGIVGTAVIAGRATEIVDVSHFMSRCFGEWVSSSGRRSSARDATRQVLMVDDSSFFRNMLKPLLTAAGYAVTSVATADEALQLRAKGMHFDAIISDIEMPGMDGFEFASEIRRNGGWRDVPLLALSAHASPRDFARGRDAGFDDYVAKFDRDALLASLNEHLDRPHVIAEQREKVA